MSKLVNRLKNENLDQGVMLNQIMRFNTKKRTLRGTISPHHDAQTHPEKKEEISDLDDFPFEDGLPSGKAFADKLDLSLSD